MAPIELATIGKNTISEAEAEELLFEAQAQYTTFVEVSGLNTLDALGPQLDEQLIPSSFMPLDFIVWP